MELEGEEIKKTEERVFGETSKAVFMVAERAGPIELISYFGLGAPDQSAPNKYRTVSNIAEALLPQEAAGTVAFAVYNTKPITPAEASQVTLGNFLDNEIAVSLVDSLDSVEATGAILSCESYSGGAFLALLAAASVDPGHPLAERFREAVNKKTSKIVVMSPAIVAGEYGNSGVDILEKFVMGESQPFMESLAAWVYTWKESYKLKSVGHFLDHQVGKIQASYVARARHLTIFKNVFLEALDKIDTVPKLPEIIVVQHGNDEVVPCEVNRKYLERLRDLGIVSKIRLLETSFKDPHCLYAAENMVNAPQVLRDATS